jgi:hypothetical protein
MGIALALKIISIAKQAYEAGRDVKAALDHVQKKLEQVHAEGRDLTPAEFEELEARIAVKMEELLR